jgi:hypothetical protein
MRQLADSLHHASVHTLAPRRQPQVPFRLTRMMIKAMEVSGIEGNFRTTCEAVLRVLRTHKDSLMVRSSVTRGCRERVCVCVTCVAPMVIH